MRTYLFYLVLLILIITSCQQRPFLEVAAVRTGDVSGMLATSATAGGTITDLGTGISDYGVCWSTSGTPSVTYSKTSLGAAASRKNFTAPLNNLKPGTKYYVAAYAQSGSMVVYGTAVTFTTPDGKPSLSSADATAVTTTSATLSSTITADGGAPVTARGVCWSTSPTPTISDNKTSDGSGTGTYSSSLTGLSPNTTYYVRPYATNSLGTVYGTAILIKTFDGIITFKSTVVSLIKANTALIGDTIVSDGGAAITARGVCWSTNQNPNISGSKTIDGSGIGPFTSSLTGLTASTTYYVRAYATNSVGAAYGAQVTFTTFYGSVSDVDGNTYNTVKIGDQVWMAENLKTTKYNDGTSIPNITDNTVWSSVTSDSYCWYNNDISNKVTYGALYNFYAITTNKLAPLGWHVPTNAEWNALSNYLGGDLVSGGKLKETGLAHWESPNEGATNESGFSGLPAGDRETSFNWLGRICGLWSSTEHTAWNTALHKSLTSYDSYMSMGNPAPFTNGLSVRCILGPLSLPVLTTTPITDFTTTTATLGGNVTSDGGLSVTTKGVCYGTSPHPGLSGTRTNDGSGTGNFTSNLNGLAPGTTYYARAYATNSGVTAYGNELSFTTAFNPDQTVSDADGNLYHVVKIGLQLWMIENLKTTKFRNGDPIPYWLTTGGPAGYCWYNDDIANKNPYGAIYHYDIIMDSRSICPPGWHIPGNDDWTTLINTLGGTEVAGGKVKEAGTAHWASPNTGATNESGFSALPGGYRDCGNNYGGLGTQCDLWILDPLTPGWMTLYSINNTQTSMNYGKGFTCNAGYIRCIKD